MARALTDEMRQFLDDPRFAVLATVNADGSPQQTVMWYLLEGDEILMNTMRGRRKDRNVGRDPRLSVCVEDGYRYLTLTGPVATDEDGGRAQADILRLAARYHGREDAARMVAESFSLQERVSLRMRIEDIDAHGFGGGA